VTTLSFDVGSVRLTRVGYAEVDVPPEAVGLTAEEVRAVAWAQPTWANGDQPRAAAAAWIIEHDGARIVVDPAQAADDILRTDTDAAVHQEAFAKLLADAGFARETITHAVATHIDGVGMLAWRNDDGTWEPFISNAPIMLSQREVDSIDSGEHPGAGRIYPHVRAAVQSMGDREELTREVSVECTGAHTPGHQIVRIDSDGQRAVIVGHLAVVPLHLETGPCTRQHVDADAAWAALRAIRDEGTLLIGPLWPEPGAGRWTGTELLPAR
jgi:glyoxylase-like metal-dependent hydrolase (beta-lactamase superfamily II)